MKIGLITYHSAYNFGSILQAYATQKVLEALGNEVEIINYRMPSQKNYYSLFPKGMNFKTKFKYIFSIPTLPDRRKRQKKYENIISSVFNLSQEFEEPEDVNKIKDNYDIFISGSDQIWNRHSNELFNVDWKKYMGPYLLNFTDKKKISYASSIVNMTDEELLEIKNDLNEFDYISCREESAKQRIEKLLNKQVYNVLDPTFLIKKEKWINFLGNWQNPYTKSKYILYYSLKGTRSLNKDLSYLNKKYVNTGYKIIAIVPLSFVLPYKNVAVASDAAVYDFLGLINNAQCIITDSYHGTILSINLNKNVYSLQESEGKNIRIEQVAEKLGFKERIIYDLRDVNVESVFDYSDVNINIQKKRDTSLNYLIKSIEMLHNQICYKIDGELYNEL